MNDSDLVKMGAMVVDRFDWLLEEARHGLRRAHEAFDTAKENADRARRDYYLALPVGIEIAKQVKWQHWYWRDDDYVTGWDCCGGVRIADAAEEVVHLARIAGVSIEFSFNGCKFVCVPNATTPADIKAAHNSWLKQQAENV